MFKRNAPQTPRYDRELFVAIEAGRISATVNADVAEWYAGVKSGRIVLQGL